MSASGRPIVFGEVLFDCFPDGSRVLGGAPFNVAWHLRGFGEAPLFISRVGDDAAGAEVRSAMIDWGLDTTGLQTDERHPTGSVQIRLVDGEPHFDILPDQAYDCISAAELPAPERPAFLYHGSLALRSEPARAALEALRTHDALQVFLDVNLRPPWWSVEGVDKMIGRATWVKLNEDELIKLTEGDGNVVCRAQNLRDHYGLERVVVTRGAEGALAVTAGLETASVRPEAIPEVIDTVGAGDAFASVLMLGLLRGWKLEQTLRRAQGFASSIVGVRGATVADPHFYRKHLESWRAD